MSRVLHMSQHDRAERRIDKSMTTIFLDAARQQPIQLSQFANLPS